MKQIIYILFVFFFIHCSQSNETNQHGLRADTVVVFYEENRYSNSDSTDLVFKGTFDDTIVFYLKDSLKFSFPLHTTDLIFGVARISTTEDSLDIKIVLKNQKRFVKFKIEKGFPYCYIQRRKGYWIVQIRSTTFVQIDGVKDEEGLNFY